MGYEERAWGPSAGRKPDGANEDRVIAPACSLPPEGHAKGSLRLPADKAVELEIVDSMSRKRWDSF